MERVPFEVRVHILNSLTYKDKLACSLVSKDWQRLIKPYLFTNVKIQDDQNLTTAIAYFEKYPEVATNVLQIETELCDSVSLYLSQIQKLFPKLNKLDYYTRTISQPEHTGTLGPWNSLEELNITEAFTKRDPALLQLILSNQCPNLTALSIDNLVLIWESIPTYSENRFPRLVNLLQNAPQLSKLKISSVKCRLLDLEPIHEKAPNLKSLVLSGIKFVKHGTSRPNTADLRQVQLAELNVRFTDANYDNAFIFNWFVRKYAGLSSLSITMDDRFADIEFNNYTAAEQGLFSRNPRLKYFDQNFFVLTPTIVDEIDRCGVQLEGIKLYISTDDVELQCDALYKSNQSQSLNHVFLYLRYPDWDDELPSLEYALESVGSLTNLTDLAMDSSDRACFSQFTRFLNMVPQISKVSLNYATVKGDKEDVEEIETSLQLKKIEIRDLEVDSREACGVINVVIRKLLPYCPDLEEFVLDMDLSEASNDDFRPITLDFRKNPKLKSIFVDTKADCNQYHIKQKSSASSGYYFYDEEKRMIEKMDALIPGEYYTTIVLSQPVLLNSCQL